MPYWLKTQVDRHPQQGDRFGSFPFSVGILFDCKRSHSLITLEVYRKNALNIFLNRLPIFPGKPLMLSKSKLIISSKPRGIWEVLFRVN
jgi:hypothetical protein